MTESPFDRNRFRLLVVILGSLTAFAPLSIDMYLPAFGRIAEEFRVPQASVELSLATFFIGLSLGQLLYGTATDRYGRKLPLYIGLTIYCVSSLICAVAPNVETLIVVRFFQALGGCAGIVIARAMVRDLFEQRDAARVFSLLLLVMGVAPILAPLVGGYVTLYLGWRAIFFVVAVFSAICLLAVYKYLPETRESNPEAKLSRTFAVYSSIARDREFLGFTLTGGLAQAGMFAYITGSPFVFINLFGVPAERFGWIFGFNALGLIVFSQINARLLRTREPNQILRWSVAAIAVFAVFLILAGVFNLGFGAVLLGLFLYVASLGMVLPNATAGALSQQVTNAGAASALFGTIQYTLAAMSSALVSYLNNGTTLPMTVMIGVCGICSFSALRLLITIHSPAAVQIE